MLWESLGIVGTQETHLDPLSALSTFDIPGGFRVALVSPSVGQFLPLPLAPAEGDYKSEKAPENPVRPPEWHCREFLVTPSRFLVWG